MRKIIVVSVLLGSALSAGAGDQLTANQQAMLAQRAKEVHERQEPLAEEIEAMIGDDTQLTLYSIESKVDYHWRSEGKTDGVDIFRDRPIRGYTEIKERTEVRALLRALISGMRESDGKVALCFEPHHGLKIERDGKKVDLLICFTCLQGQAFGAYNGNDFLITQTPLAEFNASLLKHHLPFPSFP